MSKDIITLESKAQQLDEAAAKYSAALSTEKSPFTAALVLAQGIKALRGLLTDDIMNEIMALADTPLGFMTDKKDKGGYAPKEIKDAIIGKWQRKLYAAVLNQLQGIVTPDGEIDDSISTEATVVTESKEKAQGPEPTEGTWEGKLTKVERKPYATGKEEEGWYFILTIDNGWRASTLSESIHEQAEIAVGLDVRMEVKAGKSRGNFNIESFEVLKPQQEETATEQDDLPME